MAREFESTGRIFGIPEELFAPAKADLRLRCSHMGHDLENPLGVAAGPHTQLSQNIVASYLVGARFIELKTVQILDHLDVTKPCIDMRDLGYNCEWSQELTLDESFGEYANAFILVHALARARGANPTGFGFNMSVGYNLEGIKSAPVQLFIARMRDAARELEPRIEAVRRAFAGTSLAFSELDVPSRISNDITLSTMHGCPPDEIERIGLYLIEELGVHTTIKLNPTLLGPERLRHILHERLGHTSVEVPDEAFEHDPSFEDAAAIVESLDRAAKKAQVRFAVKLTNTLETRNIDKVLPEKEALHYMSGRALHPLTAALAALLAQRFHGTIPLSLSGGVDAFNAADLLACGVRPLTVSSDLLRPGGYGRLSQYLERIAVRFDALGVTSLDELPLNAERLAAYAERAADDPRYSRRGAQPTFSSKRPLELVDCMSAPCRERCPAHQNAPEYLGLAAEGRPDEALAAVLRDNPLPAITGCACNHPCTEECARNLLDEPVAIREVKRWVEENGSAGGRGDAVLSRPGSIGIVGAGPAGLAAATFCRRAGFEVVVYEKNTRAGGIPATAIPRFRLDEAAVARDVARVEALGVRFEFTRKLGADIAIADLLSKHRAVFIATGAGTGRRLEVPGDRAAGVYDAIDFLERIKAGDAPEMGHHVVVVGGGNSAMDAARAAKRSVGEEGRTTLVYRRTRDEMPAAKDEIACALAEGVLMEELLAPRRVLEDERGQVEGLECVAMRLGEKDTSGRRRPVPVEGKTRVIEADAIVVAVGQGRGALDIVALEGLAGVAAGGDVRRGASTIIEAVADARAFAEAAAKEAGLPSPERFAQSDRPIDVNALLSKKSRRQYGEADPRAEAARCLDCDALCALCVTVCPNRANVLYEVEPAKSGFAQRFQTANVVDFCNACGNCTAFCPTSGSPYRDKPRICLSEEAAAEIRNGTVFLLSRDGWRIEVRSFGDAVRVVCGEDAGASESADSADADLARLGRALYAAFGHLAEHS